MCACGAQRLSAGRARACSPSSVQRLTLGVKVSGTLWSSKLSVVGKSMTCALQQAQTPQGSSMPAALRAAWRAACPPAARGTDTGPERVWSQTSHAPAVGSQRSTQAACPPYACPRQPEGCGSPCTAACWAACGRSAPSWWSRTAGRTSQSASLQQQQRRQQHMERCTRLYLVVALREQDLVLRVHGRPLEGRSVGSLAACTSAGTSRQGHAPQPQQPTWATTAGPHLCSDST